MDGKFIAILSSLFLWFITYLISLFFVSFKLSNGIIPDKIRAKITEKELYKYLIISSIFLPFLASKMFDFGAFLATDYIIWGCCIEDFTFGMTLLWFLFSLIFTIVLLFGIKSFKRLKFQSRKDLLLAYFIHLSYSFLMTIVFILFIYLFTGDLHGKSDSCW